MTPTTRHISSVFQFIPSHKFVAPRGVEPRSSGPKPDVIPIYHRAMKRIMPIVSFGHVFYSFFKWSPRPDSNRRRAFASGLQIRQSRPLSHWGKSSFPSMIKAYPYFNSKHILGIACSSNRALHVYSMRHSFYWRLSTNVITVY